MKNNLFQKSSCALPVLAVPAIMLCLPALGEAAALPDAVNTNVSQMGKQSHADAITLYKGQVKLLDIHGAVRRVAVGNGNLVTASVVDQQLLLLAQAPGETSLVVWTDHGVVLDAKVVITTADRSETLKRIADGLPFVRGLTVEQAGGKFVVKGAIYPEQAEQLRSALAGLDDVISLIEVDGGLKPQKTVHFRVQIIDIDKNAMQNLGVNWATQINGPQGALAINGLKTGRYRNLPSNDSATFDSSPSSVAGAASGVFFGIATSITSMINLALSDGTAYIVAAPELNSRSGGKADFLSGGEVPIPISGAFGSTNVEYKPYGIKLEISPTVGSNGVISADLTTEISQPDYSNEINGYPSFTTRRTSSQMSLRSGETLAISGLASNVSSSNTNKVPWLGNLPLLGSLFRSKSSNSSNSELVIFVTPTIVDASAPENETLLSRARDIDSRFSADIGASPLAAPVPASAPSAPAPALPPRAATGSGVPNTLHVRPVGTAAATGSGMPAPGSALVVPPAMPLTVNTLPDPVRPAIGASTRDPSTVEHIGADAGAAVSPPDVASGPPVAGRAGVVAGGDANGADFMFGESLKH